jgi:phenylalanyl-tRNA synthetase alpha chain
MNNPPTAKRLNLDELATIREVAAAAILAASDLEDLKSVRLAHLGDKSPIALANRELGKLAAEDKAKFGAAIGEHRKFLTDLHEQKQTELQSKRDEQILTLERVDVSLAGLNLERGGIHPLTATMNRIIEIFVAMGYQVDEGPEAEAELLNFDALNIPTNHPARSMQDTFYIESPNSGIVLRTQTSPVQIRSLLKRDLPVYVISPGKVFRSDELDQTHTPVFHQVEGLVVDKGIGMAELKGTIDHFAKEMFGSNVKTRLRPSYFPFTEPSAEMDVYFQDRWVEWGGCGVVNPKVLAAVGIDPTIYSGFAFGMGIERTLMFRNGVSDMRDMVEGDVRFTKMFGAIS